jgi:hypothetical protein
MIKSDRQIKPKIVDKEKQLDYFTKERPELTDYVLNKIIPGNHKFKIVRAPVKSGKRGMVEVNSLNNKDNEHIFLTALHRVADISQRNELESYGIKVFSVNSGLKKDACIKFINGIKNKKCLIHLDELDFGCGDKQLLNSIYMAFKENVNVLFILYSATIEVAKKEFLINKIDFFECPHFVPPPTYFGIKKYIDNKLFFQATGFISYENNALEITTQGKELIEKLKQHTINKNNKRHIGVLRLAGNFKIEGKVVSQFEKLKEYQDSIEDKYNIRLKFIGSNDGSIVWDSPKYWDELTLDRSFIFVINQVSGRSTEWKCHPYLVWFHTLRTEETPTSSIIQDQERSVYYTKAYTDDINIEIYGDLPTAQYSAGIITFDQYSAMVTRKINSRLNTKNKKKHIRVKTPAFFNTWEEIPDKYKKGRSKTTYVNEDYKLKEEMINSGITYHIADWDEKWLHLEGFLMTNIRSSRDNFIKGKGNQKPIWFKNDILTELSEGINEHSKIRINVFYEDNETNPDNFKFIVREFDIAIDAPVANTSMYNN